MATCNASTVECLNYFYQVLNWINKMYSNISMTYRLFKIGSSVHLELTTKLLGEKEREIVLKVYKYIANTFKEPECVEVNLTEKKKCIKIYAICGGLE